MKAKYKVVLTLGTEIFEPKTTTVFLVDFYHEVKTRAVEIERNLKLAQDTMALSGSREKKSKKNV